MRNTREIAKGNTETVWGQLSAIAGGDLSKFVADDFVAPIGRIDRFNDGDEEAL